MAEQKTKSRSEKLRAKRENKGKRTLRRKPRETQYASQNMPPVLIRGGFASMVQPQKKKKSKTPKRRYDIALSSPGVEIRLPALPSVGFGWRLLSAVMAVGLLVLFYHLWTSPLYQVQIAELEGNQYLNSESINQALNLHNKTIFLIDPQQLETDVQNAFQGLLIDSSVQIIWPATVIVTIQERQPIIAWEQGGNVVWVDVEGISFDPLGENDRLVKISASAPPPAPIVVGDTQVDSQAELGESEDFPLAEPLMSPQMAAAIVTMNEYAPNENSLTYNPQHGLGWHDAKRDWDVYFGVDVSNIEEKLTVYKGIKAQLKKDSTSPALISVEHVHAPYYRLEP